MKRALYIFILFFIFQCCGKEEKKDIVDIITSDKEFQDDYFEEISGEEFEEGEAGKEEIEKDIVEEEVSLPSPWIIHKLIPDITINSLWSSDEAGFYAVGDKGTLLYFYEGIFVPVNIPTEKNLYGIYGLGEDIYIVGEGGVIFYGKGGVWQKINSPSDQNLRAVYVADKENVFIVGDNGLILYKNGKDFEIEKTNVPYHLYAVYGVLPTNLYAVGQMGVLLQRYTGGTWVMQQIAEQNLRAVWLSKNNYLYTVGGKGVIVRGKDGIYKAQLSNDSLKRDLYAILGISDNEIYVAGDKGAIILYNGKKWTLMDIEGPYNTYKNFRSLGAKKLTENETEIFAAGEDRSFLKFDGETWKDFTSESVINLNGIESYENNILRICADKGLVFKYSDGKWGIEKTFTVENLSSISKDYIAGFNGTLLKKEGNLWKNIEINVKKNFYGISSSDEKIYLCGENGTLIQKTLSELKEIKDIPKINLYAIKVIKETAYIAGENGGVFSLKNNEIKKFSPPTTSTIRDILPFSEKEIYVCGDYGIIFKWDGKEWKKILEDPVSFLYGIDGLYPFPVASVGWAGNFIVFDGKEWKKLTPPIPYTLDTVKVLKDSIFAAGRDGKILEYRIK